MQVICSLLSLFVLAMLGRVILSWFPPEGVIRTLQDILARATDWCIVPIRRMLPTVQLGGMGLDLSPMVVILGVSILQRVIC